MGGKKRNTKRLKLLRVMHIIVQNSKPIQLCIAFKSVAELLQKTTGKYKTFDMIHFPDIKSNIVNPSLDDVQLDFKYYSSSAARNNFGEGLHV